MKSYFTLYITACLSWSLMSQTKPRNLLTTN